MRGDQASLSARGPTDTQADQPWWRGARATFQERTTANDQGLKLYARGSWTAAGGDRRRHCGLPVARLGVGQG